MKCLDHMARTWAKAGLGVNVYLLGQAAIAKECGWEREKMNRDAG